MNARAEKWNAREEAARCVAEILTGQGYTSIVLNRRIRTYPPSVSLKDKALVTSLVYTTATRCLTIDFLLDQYSKTPVRRMKPFIAAVLRVACAQMLYMDRIPNRAAIYEAVETVKASPYKNLSGFVNGVLRAVDRGGARLVLPADPLARASVEYSVPEFMLAIWEKAYGADAMKTIAAVSAEKKPLSVRCNTRLTSPEALQAELCARLGHENVRRSESSPALFYLRTAEDLASWAPMTEGRMTVQDESSMFSALSTGVRPGMRVLDLCSAPGGKAALMAEMMDDSGLIRCCDLYPHKLELIRQNAERLHLHILKPCLRDGTVPVPQEKETYDAVLLDAPCSGFGVLRSKPDIRWKRKEEDIENLRGLQRRLLTAAADYVKPGGRLVYSTCTLSPKENEENAAWFLARFPEFSPGNLQKDLPSLPMCDTIENGKETGWQTFLPQREGRDGFFIASFQKSGRGA